MESQEIFPSNIWKDISINVNKNNQTYFKKVEEETLEILKNQKQSSWESEDHLALSARGVHPHTPGAGADVAQRTPKGWPVPTASCLGEAHPAEWTFRFQLYLLFFLTRPPRPFPPFLPLCC